MSSKVGQSDSKELLDSPLSSSPKKPLAQIADSRGSDALARKSPFDVIVSRVEKPLVVDMPNILNTSSASGFSLISDTDKYAGSYLDISSDLISKTDEEESDGGEVSDSDVESVIQAKAYINLQKGIQVTDNAVDKETNKLPAIEINENYVTEVKCFDLSDPSEFPYYNFVFFDRLKSLPVVRSSYSFCQQTKRQLFSTSANMMKFLTTAVCFPVSFMASSTTKVCRMPISFADYVMCKCLDVAGTIFPCITVPPNQMFGATVDGVTDCVCFCPRAAKRGIVVVCSKEKSC